MLIKVSRIIQAISSEVGLELLPSCPQILALATFSFQQKAEFRKWILYETVDPPPDKNSVWNSFFLTAHLGPNPQCPSKGQLGWEQCLIFHDTFKQTSSEVWRIICEMTEVKRQEIPLRHFYKYQQISCHCFIAKPKKDEQDHLYP